MRAFDTRENRLRSAGISRGKATETAKTQGMQPKGAGPGKNDGSDLESRDTIGD